MNSKPKPSHKSKKARVFVVGQCVRASTQYDGTVLAEIVAIDGHVIVVKSVKGKTYRLLSSEVI